MISPKVMYQSHYRYHCDIEIKMKMETWMSIKARIVLGVKAIDCRQISFCEISLKREGEERKGDDEDSVATFYQTKTMATTPVRWRYSKTMIKRPVTQVAKMHPKGNRIVCLVQDARKKFTQLDRLCTIY